MTLPLPHFARQAKRQAEAPLQLGFRLAFICIAIAGRRRSVCADQAVQQPAAV